MLSFSFPWKGLHKITELTLALAVIGFAVTTYHSNSVWKDEIALYENVLKYTHHDPQIYSNLGSAYAIVGRLDEAEKCFLKALEMNPSMLMARDTLETVRREKKDKGYAR